MPKLTKRTVEAAEPADQAWYLWDDQPKGFGVKILPSGDRKYVLKYRAGGGGRAAPQRWLSLGRHGSITLDQARALAQAALAAIARGQDPQAERLDGRAAATVADLWARYEADHLPRKKSKSQVNDRQLWRDYLSPALGRKRAADLTVADIDRLHRGLREKPYTANRALALLSKMLALSERWGLRPVGSNPCRTVERFKEEGRERYLNSDELTRLGQAMRDGLAAQSETPHMIAAVQLLLLTGARLNEILAAEWAWVDLDRRVISLPDSKTGRKPIYLGQGAVAILRRLQQLPTYQSSPYVICGRRPERPLVNLAKPWARLCQRAKLDGVRLHDLRHTAASVGVAQGMSLPIIGRLLGHSQPSTTHRYAHVAIDPALAAADLIGEAMASALSPPSTAAAAQQTD
ncbi:MAG: tyrosine-type recombinase/integrase [Geminicoccaceae bacterium]